MMTTRKGRPAGEGRLEKEHSKMGENRLAKIVKEPLLAPGRGDRLLLHSCCAPCSGGIIETLLDAGIAVTVFFYNPNIEPHSEYLLRREENKRFADRLGVPFIAGDDLSAAWRERVAGLEREPERGRRCDTCFSYRLEATARIALERGVAFFATTLGVSRWKDLAQVDACGRRAAAGVSGVRYWDRNWRKGGGTQRMIEISRREGFYHQEYCGCRYSLEETNRWRQQRGRPLIDRTAED